jgi:hypothetical protein
VLDQLVAAAAAAAAMSHSLAPVELLLHVLWDLVERDVTRTLVHHLQGKKINKS